MLSCQNPLGCYTKGHQGEGAAGSRQCWGWTGGDGSTARSLPWSPEPGEPLQSPLGGAVLGQSGGAPHPPSPCPPGLPQPRAPRACPRLPSARRVPQWPYPAPGTGLHQDRVPAASGLCSLCYCGSVRCWRGLGLPHGLWAQSGAGLGVPGRCRGRGGATAVRDPGGGRGWVRGNRQ